MKFLDEDLLLGSELAVKLYRCVKDLPIVDYHSHLSPREIAEDKRFYNLAQLWLAGDHYKWRLMRACGVPEEKITGGASDREKFLAFAEILPLCIGNPIYIWCHLELKKYFGIKTPVCAETAAEIYDATEKQMRETPFTARGCIRASNVELLCTTDDPADDLIYHRALAEDASLGFRVLPSFRPDKAVHIELPAFAPYVCALTGKQSPTAADIRAALCARLDYFAAAGCFVSDHALDTFIYEERSEAQLEKILAAALRGEKISAQDAEGWQTALLCFLAGEYKARNIAMQLHFNCQRNINAKMYGRLGPDTGYDSINVSASPRKLAQFFDALEQKNSLPKTIVYSLNPQDDKLINTIIGSFQGGARGKMQHGSAWWFNDTKGGMRAHLQTLSEYGVLGNFIGMLTDSRSFTSYVRHDYFRRILCDHLANCALCGEYPADEKALSELAAGISLGNAKRYFGLN